MPDPKRAAPPPVERAVMSDDLFAAALSRFAEDERMHPDNFPPPAHGYADRGWQQRAVGGPTAPALRAIVQEAAGAQDMSSADVAGRLVEQLFAMGLKDHRARPTDEDGAMTLDGRALVAILITHFLASHCVSVETLRLHMHTLDRDEQRALWDALDPKEQRWAGKPALPELETALWDMYSTPPGEVAPPIIGAVAGALYGALGGKGVGDMVDELLVAAFSLAEWSTTMRAEMAHVNEDALLHALAAAPLAPLAVKAVKAEVEEEVAATPAAPAAPAVMHATPSWAPASVVRSAPLPSRAVDPDEDEFERQLREACMATVMRRRQAI